MNLASIQVYLSYNRVFCRIPGGGCTGSVGTLATCLAQLCVKKQVGTKKTADVFLVPTTAWIQAALYELWSGCCGHVYRRGGRVHSWWLLTICTSQWPSGGGEVGEILCCLRAKLTLSSPSIRRAMKAELHAIAGFPVDNSLGRGDRV
jgi:hypothetical protein